MHRAIFTAPPLTVVTAEAELYLNSHEAAAASGFRQFCTLSAGPMVLLRTPNLLQARECSTAQHRSEVASAAEPFSRYRDSELAGQYGVTRGSSGPCL